MISGEGGLVNKYQTRRGLPKETDKSYFSVQQLLKQRAP